MTVALTTFGFALSQVIVYVGLDYTFYQLLSFISRLVDVTIDFSQNVLVDSELTIKTPGNATEGLMTQLANRTASQMQNFSSASLPILRCRPMPMEPDYEVYGRIGVFLAIAFVTVFLESYSLRFRHWICDWFYPAQRKRRARALCFRILAQQGSLVTYVATQTLTTSAVNFTFFDRIGAQIPLLRPVLKVLGLVQDKQLCDNCGKVTEGGAFSRCPQRDCGAIYCKNCEARLENCNLCKNPIRFVGIDLTLEKDSSEEETDEEDDSDTDTDTDTKSTVTMSFSS